MPARRIESIFPTTSPLKLASQKTISCSPAHQHWGHSGYCLNLDNTNDNSNFAHYLRRVSIPWYISKSSSLFPSAFCLQCYSQMGHFQGPLLWKHYIDPFDFFLNAIAKEIFAGKSGWCISTQTSSTRHYPLEEDLYYDYGFGRKENRWKNIFLGITIKKGMTSSVKHSRTFQNCPNLSRFSSWYSPAFYLKVLLCLYFPISKERKFFPGWVLSLCHGSL